ncbi:glycosyltransferase [Candidatus Berkiella cookevillensis]|uniref:Glycosyltransferase n=1 Tax=Candidatus Berkiella cookevillensis TaxID=437022 RepID=A0A0Q9Y8Y3_9GAMM|nr:glycosyltransferase family 2 protein [Candidatus Berkiella cookevillensis]MCS5707717.1 glycosyltransferase [Candidatus Berkiella cookevillensis]
MIKVSIITVCYNSEKTIEETILSVKSQSYYPIEYIVIDGASKDNTLSIVEKYRDTIDVLVSEKDAGIYDAMNKGIEKATGEVIGFLNADDLFAHPDAIKKIVDVFESSNAEAVYGDLVYFSRKNRHDKIVRYFKSSRFKQGDFAKGWCPPHPTFYVRKSVYERLGGFNLKLEMGNDVELMMRFLEKEKIKSFYIPEVLVKMRMGGVSNQSLKNIWVQNRHILQAAKDLHIPIPLLPFVFHKLLNRASQYLARFGV